ncbi:hypothetical protein C9374_003623 [Naegleria lovaniensis]|uniref:Mannosyl-oligosaccharide glucosidase n=1 Tax=Naegleria lovaniensis TaxID=51637 RepID=A0AA88H5I5_NAELO|nr:uncharacterized protein C9374_003623 [Naegleria lovaniensis]KAG2393859.1 hypothetical protein C9374_003623 [Naegleria lovaniensis]
MIKQTTPSFTQLLSSYHIIFFLLLLFIISTHCTLVMSNTVNSDDSITIEQECKYSEPIFQTQFYNHTMKWGTYRPQVIFGMKTRSPKPILTGLMWHRADTVDGISKLRHDSNMDFNNVRYGWNRHDGQYFAMQNIRDFENLIQLDTKLLKHVEEKTFIPASEDDEVNTNSAEQQQGEYHFNEKGGDWTVRIIGKDLKQLKNKPVLSLCFYIALENEQDVSLRISGVQGSKKHGLASNTPIIIRGKNQDVGEFSIHVTANEVNPVDDHNNFYFYGVKKNPGDVWKIHQDVKQMLSHQMMTSMNSIQEKFQEQQMKGQNVGTSPWDTTPFPIATLPNTIDDDSNVLVIQKIVRSPFDLNVVFLSHEQHPDIFSNYQIKEHALHHLHHFDANIKKLKSCFETKFEETFHLKDKIFNSAGQDEKEMAMYALSNLVGGIGYYYGDSYHQYGNGEIRTIPPYSLFTACPCRSFFPRGFLWDEGFHSLLIQRWNKQISKDIITNWFHVMDKSTGWIPREQILGEEARSRVPREFQVQHDTHANPPVLFLGVFELLQQYYLALQSLSGEEKPTTTTTTQDTLKTIELDLHGTQHSFNNHDSSSGDKSLISSERESMISFLKQVYPLMKKNYEWYLSTQAGSVPNTFRWRGRTPGHTLSSGLDDYPRGNTQPSSDERHLDLYSWIYMMTDTMNRIHEMVFKKQDPILVQRLETLRANIMTYHFNKDIHWFSDYAGKPVGNETRPEFSPHIGYVSLFPFLLDVVNFEKHPTLLDHVLNTIIRERLWTPFGLSSLSRTDPMFGTRENYWRGPIWININYLTLRALNKCKDRSEKCHEVYTLLRKNIMSTLSNEWKRSRTIYEQYNALNGNGQGAHPFTGWSSLITLIMGEIY